VQCQLFATLVFLDLRSPCVCRDGLGFTWWAKLTELVQSARESCIVVACIAFLTAETERGYFLTRLQTTTAEATRPPIAVESGITDGQHENNCGRRAALETKSSHGVRVCCSSVCVLYCLAVRRAELPPSRIPSPQCVIRPSYSRCSTNHVEGQSI
jgi:hypothetical protein